MKKLSYLVIGCIIGAIVTYSFKPEDIQSNSMGLTQKKRVKKPEGVITRAEAKALNDNWTKFRGRAVDSASKKHGGKKKDTRNVWWSIEDIEDYIAYARYEADSLGYSVTGLRVYLGVYGHKEKRKKRDLTTMFIVPTGERLVSKGSSFNLSLGDEQTDMPTDPLNKGTGGQGTFPPN